MIRKVRAIQRELLILNQTKTVMIYLEVLEVFFSVSSLTQKVWGVSFIGKE